MQNLELMQNNVLFIAFAFIIHLTVKVCLIKTNYPLVHAADRPVALAGIWNTCKLCVVMGYHKYSKKCFKNFKEARSSYLLHILIYFKNAVAYYWTTYWFSSKEMLHY